MYRDTMTVYRPRQTQGVLAGYDTKGSNRPCNIQNTDNFDENRGGGIRFKQSSILTSDQARCHIDEDVQAEDVVKFTDRRGNVSWGTIEGAPKNRSWLAYQTFYVLPFSRPNGLDPTEILS